MYFILFNGHADLGEDGGAKMEFYSCKVNHLKNPLGFDMTDTVFS